MLNKLSLINILDSCKYSIDSIAFSPCGQYLSASSNNNILIYHLQSRLHLTTLYEDAKNVTYRVIIWVNNDDQEKKLSNYRLITVGLHGIITDWNLETLQMENKCSSYGGAIFTGVKSYSNDYILVGCDDGCVRMFKLWDCNVSNVRTPVLILGDVYIKNNKSVLSIHILPDDSFFCGTSNSIIFNYNKTNNELKTIKVNNGANGDDNICIWSLIYIQKYNNLVSGDSNGNIIIWNINTYTVIKIFNQHELDVLSLCIGNNDGDTFYSAGIDGKLVLYTYNNKHGWYINSIKYLNRNNNLRSMTIHPYNNFIATAGTDGIISLIDNNKTKLITSNIPSWINSSIDLNRNKTMILCKYLHHCDLWYLPSSTSKYNTEDPSTSIRPADSSSNYLPVNGIATPRDHGGEEGIVGKDKTSSGSGIPVADLREAEGEVNREAPCNGKDEPKVEADDTTCSEYNGIYMGNKTSNESTGNIYNNMNKIRNIDDKSYTSSDISLGYPYKLAMIKLKEDGGYISVAKISPDGDLIGIVNQKGLMILKFDIVNLKIEYKKIKNKNLMISSMDFIDEDNMILCHYMNGRFNICVYNILNDVLSDIECMHFIKSKIIKFKILGKYIICYNIYGNVYLLDEKLMNVYELPQFENDWKITCITICPHLQYLVVFSNTFRYYFYDLNSHSIIPYDDIFIHHIPNKLINHNTIIFNAIWIHSINRIIIQTGIHVISITIDTKLFYTCNERSTCGDVQDNEVIGESDKAGQITAKHNDDINGSGGIVSHPPDDNTTHPSDDTILLPLPAHPSSDIDSDVSLRFKRKKVYIGPRRLYNVPSKEMSIYNPMLRVSSGRDMITNNIKRIKRQCRYNCIRKIKYIAHMDIRHEDNLMNILVFHILPTSYKIINKKHYGN